MEIAGHEGVLLLIERDPEHGLILAVTEDVPIDRSALAIEGRDEGVIIRGIRDLIAMAPPLTVTREEVDILFDAVRKGLDRLW